ncbi:TetR/AcrR family transcriptional regulator [Mesorhizobium sp. LHD-90]|uniref:TetR/AcrR family transcriptional regulator n=1 Tax=Mesorhizobium sp. LHD-90 TaxID=3071414 RepID=UPI0027E03E43|nr:TetR/AcrR family transcriptional regulator [Mesorhizobium sp. LHD-90]MDQ6435642.1 TetR/AcrR family transcriptional regulator [Mesorhizobium sp. LHD-90]
MIILAVMGETHTRQAIKDTALELLVRHGYRGVSFGDIAATLGTTRANIHYHFGNKQTLVEEVLRNYVDITLAALRQIWSAQDTPLGAKVEAMVDYSRARYLHFNPDGQGGSWSLISRLRQDADLLSPQGRRTVDHFGSELSAIFAGALSAASQRGELGANVDANDAALLLAAIADNAAPITLAEGGFERLEAIYRSIQGLIERRTT